MRFRSLPVTLLPALGMFAINLLAQPVSFTTTGSFVGSTVIGSGENTVTLSFEPQGRQTVDPSMTSGTFTQLRLDIRGSALLAGEGKSYSFRFLVTISPENSQRSAILTGTVNLNFWGLFPIIIVVFDQGAFTVDGIAYSWPQNMSVLSVFDSRPTWLYSLEGRLTRTSLRFQPSSLRITANVGEVASQAVSIIGISSAGDVGTVWTANEFVTATLESPTTLRVRVSHNLLDPATVSVVIPVTVPGFPTALLPVETVLLPGNKFLNISPRELNFVYTRGQAPPAAQQTLVNSSDAVDLVRVSWDARWLQPTVGNGFASLLPLVTDKSAGQHRTSVVLRNESGQHSSIYANFYVNDGPGALNLSTLPAQAGVVSSNASSPAQNGTGVLLTATPQPGFVFGRWSGVVNDTANPVSVVVNGATNVVAQFVPVTGSCTYNTRPAKVYNHYFGGYGKVEIQTQSGCPWNVSDLPTWMELTSPASGNGPGWFTYRMAANIASFAPPREAFLRAGDRILMVEQGSPICTLFKTSIPGTVAAGGGTAPVLVRATNGCPYTPVGSQPWIGTQGLQLGTQQFGITAQPNTTGQPRTGMVHLAGYHVPILQRAAVPLSPFLDVAADNVFADHIFILKSNNAAATCAQDRFCPDALAVRSDMAEMLVRSMVGDNFQFSTTPRFQDVPTTHPQFRWIQKLGELGITNGCAEQRFCPGEAMSRGQMAAFLVRAKTGVPVDAAAVLGPDSPFIDVPRDSIFGPQIRDLRVLGITIGCYENAFCSDDGVTRGQLAAFLVRAFFTP